MSQDNLQITTIKKIFSNLDEQAQQDLLNDLMSIAKIVKVNNSPWQQEFNKFEEWILPNLKYMRFVTQKHLDEYHKLFDFVINRAQHAHTLYADLYDKHDIRSVTIYGASPTHNKISPVLTDETRNNIRELVIDDDNVLKISRFIGDSFRLVIDFKSLIRLNPELINCVLHIMLLRDDIESFKQQFPNHETIESFIEIEKPRYAKLKIMDMLQVNLF